MKYGLYDTEEDSWLATAEEMVLSYDTQHEAELATVIARRQLLWEPGRIVPRPLPPDTEWVKKGDIATDRTGEQAYQEVMEEVEEHRKGQEIRAQIALVPKKA